MGYSEEQLTQIAASVISSGEQILAAGLFENETAVKKRLGAFVLGDVVGGMAGGNAGSLMGIAAGEIAEKAEEGHSAKQEGLARVMLVAVTADTIHVLDWKDGASTAELVNLPRASTDVQITKSGVKQHIHLVNTEQNKELKIWGQTAGLGSMPEGDKLVTALLSTEV